VGNLGGVRSVEKNLKTVTVLSMIAACVRNSVMNQRYIFLMFFVTNMPPAEVTLGGEWEIFQQWCSVDGNACC